MQYLFPIFKHLDPFLRLSTLQRVRLGEDANCTDPVWVRFLGQGEGLLIVEVIYRVRRQTAGHAAPWVYSPFIVATTKIKQSFLVRRYRGQ
jgi:hypothetical protein